MSRRMLDSAIWSNENFAALPPRGRLLQIGMINIADDQGRLKAHPLYLAKEIFPYDHTEAIDVSKWLEQMVEHGTIALYMVEGKQYAQFRNWWEYQSLQFAHPSSYPRPEGWQDRIRFNGKGNQMLASNWVTPKGDRMIDTCDQDGRPLPFVMELPRANKAAEAGTRVPTLVPAEVRTLVPAEVPAEVPTQVTPNLTNNYQLTTKEEGREASLRSALGADAPAPTLSLKEHALIRAFHEMHKRYPSKPQMAAIIEKDPPIADWVRAIHAWALAGHNPTNIQGMLDWAFEPSRYEKHSAGNGDDRKTGYSDYVGEAPPADEDRLAWRAEMTRAKVAKEAAKS